MILLDSHNEASCEPGLTPSRVVELVHVQLLETTRSDAVARPSADWLPLERPNTTSIPVQAASGGLVRTGTTTGEIAALSGRPGGWTAGFAPSTGLAGLWVER